jgi:hypothetical protein
MSGTHEEPVSIADGFDAYECFIGLTTLPIGTNPEIE